MNTILLRSISYAPIQWSFLDFTTISFIVSLTSNSICTNLMWIMEHVERIMEDNRVYMHNLFTPISLWGYWKGTWAGLLVLLPWWWPGLLNSECCQTGRCHSVASSPGLSFFFFFFFNVAMCLSNIAKSGNGLWTRLVTVSGIYSELNSMSVEETLDRGLNSSKVHEVRWCNVLPSILKGYIGAPYPFSADISLKWDWSGAKTFDVDISPSQNIPSI